MKVGALLALLLLLVSCRPGQISAERWKSMSVREKVLTVESLRGHEHALDRKGGGGRPHTLASAAYVERIDEMYRRGAKEPVNVVWEKLADPDPNIRN